MNSYDWKCPLNKINRATKENVDKIKKKYTVGDFQWDDS